MTSTDLEKLDQKILHLYDLIDELKSKVQTSVEKGPSYENRLNSAEQQNGK